MNNFNSTGAQYQTMRSLQPSDHGPHNYPPHYELGTHPYVSGLTSPPGYISNTHAPNQQGQQSTVNGYGPSRALAPHPGNGQYAEIAASNGGTTLGNSTNGLSYDPYITHASLMNQGFQAEHLGRHGIGTSLQHNHSRQDHRAGIANPVVPIPAEAGRWGYGYRCRQTFRRFHDALRHMRQQHEDLPTMCLFEFCPYGSTRKDNLRSHYRKKHGVFNPPI